MKLGVYSMRDNLNGYLQPTFEMSDASAIRNFEYAISQRNNILWSNAEDFDLYHLADFDNETGDIVPLDPVKRIAFGGAIKLALIEKDGE